MENILKETFYILKKLRNFKTNIILVFSCMKKILKKIYEYAIVPPSYSHKLDDSKMIFCKRLISIPTTGPTL